MNKVILVCLLFLVNCAPPVGIQIIQAYGKIRAAPNLAKVPVDSTKVEVTDE